MQQLFESVSEGRGHFGGKIAFDRNGYLFLTLGDRQVPPEGNLEAHPAQDLSNHHGKIVRLHDDGRVPADNPFVNRAGARPEIWSYGHRNVQGLAIHPETGDVWTNEHGPQGGDELNRPLPGRNYGWPVIGFGVNYTTGLAIHSGTHREGMEQPVHVWVPSIGISGAMVYTGDRFPQWKGNLFVGGMVGQRLARLTVAGPARRERGNARPADGSHPGCAPGTGRIHLSGHRRSRRQADADFSDGACRPDNHQVNASDRRYGRLCAIPPSSWRACQLRGHTCSCHTESGDPGHREI